MLLFDETPNMTIEEIRQALSDRGHVFGFGTVQRFLKRHRITRKKRLPTRQNRSTPIS
ncbi:MAG: Transposase [Rhodospirillaceae bacterium]|nr:MAG: Transposase [Rhodospirillaceae bacterium]